MLTWLRLENQAVAVKRCKSVPIFAGFAELHLTSPRKEFVLANSEIVFGKFNGLQSVVEPENRAKRPLEILIQEDIIDTTGPERCDQPELYWGESTMYQEILENTTICRPPLVPEIRLRLLDSDGPWKSSGQSLFGQDGPKPYWAFAWGSGQALARYLLDHPEFVRGKRVVDFGAGSGVAAIAAARCGAANVTANDNDPRALAAISLNAELNAVVVRTTQTEITELVVADIDVLLASDVFFHWPGNESIMGKLNNVQSILVSVPNQRGLAPGRELPRRRLRELASFEVRTVPQLEPEHISRATVYSFRSGEPTQQ